MPEQYVVICKDEDGYFVLATRQVWDTWQDALKYTNTISHTRMPTVVRGVWSELRKAD